ncbi:hypothetical protein GOARA_013_00220 [Gordonia araii NBRC 100433]|uniref:Protein DA1-like domain-containing protein n=1 Tax=Gordonia araii NBRC 100433 TaxID=1073574 RepID=G7GYA3_9ACTN|nr:hypothetical protein GOARA_013_00220 [Gordonia araii NBRC 100433]
MHEFNFHYCPRCADERVSAKEAGRLGLKALRDLQRLGMEFSIQPSFRMSEGEDRSPERRHLVTGWCSHWTINGKVTRVEVVLRRGLPRVDAISTFVHELGHAYARGEGFNASDSLEEGFCNAISYFYLNRFVPGSERHRNVIVNRSDNYGAGFREAMTILRDEGMPALLCRLKEGKAQ